MSLKALNWLFARGDSSIDHNKIMFKQETRENFKDAETIIGPSVIVKGNFNSSGNIVIEGVLKGGVKTAGNVYIGDRANITADVEAKTARIGGELRGNIKIEGELQIVASAKVFGDIECASLSVEAGAVINGKIVMTKNLPVEKPEKKEEKIIEEIEDEK
ncbi:MAG: polymer-forming cytoskeletal protein [Patescibacteria group bacterium]|nr:polymer-forming cytoskeletal protein [Patescibacteria group bacterium]